MQNCLISQAHRNVYNAHRKPNNYLPSLDLVALTYSTSFSSSLLIFLHASISCLLRKRVRTISELEFSVKQILKRLPFSRHPHCSLCLSYFPYTPRRHLCMSRCSRHLLIADRHSYCQRIRFCLTLTGLSTPVPRRSCGRLLVPKTPDPAHMLHAVLPDCKHLDERSGEYFAPRPSTVNRWRRFRSPSANF